MFEILNQVVTLSQELIRIPSRCRIDNSRHIYERIRSWFFDRNIDLREIYDDEGYLIGVYASHEFSEAGPCICLNACLDTADTGSLNNWSADPFSGIIENGWLQGRGAADSKTGASIFSVLFSNLKGNTNLRGKLYIYFDFDEHSGNFLGIKRFVQQLNQAPDFVFIGYSGNTQICAGARGIYRARLKFFGRASHTGASEQNGKNAIEMAALFINIAMKRNLNEKAELWYGLPPRITTTSVAGGSSYSVVPDVCDIGIDCRVTGKHDASWADATLREMLYESLGNDESYNIEVVASYPAYSAYESKYTDVLIKNASKVFSREITKRIAGPSNIGNALSELGILSTCGFGVAGRFIHSPNECANMDDVGDVYRSYLETILELMRK